MTWIDDYYEELGDNVLTWEDWQELEDIKEIIRPLKSLIKNTKGLKVLLNTTFNNIEFLTKYFAKIKIKFKGNI